MIKELRSASELLKTALEQYLNTCLTISSQYKFALAHSDVSDVVVEELQAITYYETHIGCSKKAIERLRNRCGKVVVVNRLPPELLARVFYLAYGPEGASQSKHTTNSSLACQRSSITLLHTCSYWRSIALSSHAFWTHIDIAPFGPNAQLSLHQARLFLSYSSGLPIDIQINMEKHDDSYNMQDILEFCALSAPRATSINVRSAYMVGDIHNSVIGRLLSNCAPGNLSRLTIKNSATSLMIANNMTEHIDPGMIECSRIEVSYNHLEDVLRHVTALHLERNFLNWTSQAYIGLAKLHLEGAFRVYTACHLAYILSASPQLRFLRLVLTLRQGDGGTEPSPVHMDHLEALYLNTNNLEDHNHVLRLIVPGSRPIRMSTIIEDETVPFLLGGEHKQFFERSNVVQLHAAMAPIPITEPNQPVAISELLSLVPNLETLSLQMFDIAYGPETDNISLGKRFTRLHLTASYIDLEELCAIVNNYPITRLAIDPEYYIKQGDPNEDKNTSRQDLLKIFQNIEFVEQRDPNDMDWD